jgi:hypothetical protein
MLQCITEFSMTKPAEAKTPKSEQPQPATPPRPIPGRFGEGLESPGSAHC